MATSNPLFNAFNGIDKSNSSVYRNRNGEIQLVASQLPATVGQHWIPSQDNTYDLGDLIAPKRWRNLYISQRVLATTVDTAFFSAGNNSVFTNGKIFVGGMGPNGIQTYNGGQPDIGKSTGRFGAIWASSLDTLLGVTAGGPSSFYALQVTGPSPTRFNQIITPMSAGVTDIGAVSLPWKDIYITGNIYKNGVLYGGGGGGGGVVGDLIPPADNVYNIGQNTTPLRWKAGYFANKVYADGGVQVVSGNVTVNSGHLQLLDGNVSCTAIDTAGDITCNFAIRPTTTNFGTLGTSSLYFNFLYCNSGRMGTLEPAITGTPVVGTRIGSSTRVYQEGYFGNVQADTLVPRLASTGSVGTSSVRYSAVWADSVNANSVTLPFVRALETGYTSADPDIFALQQSQWCVQTPAVLGINVGNPFKAVDPAEWKSATAQALIASESGSGKFAIHKHEYRMLPFGNGAIVFVMLVIQLKTWAEGGGIPDSDPFFIRVTYKQPTPAAVKSAAGAWCGMAQCMQWGQFVADGSNINDPALYSWFMRQGNGGVFSVGPDGLVHIMVEPMSESKPATNDRFTITAMYFV